MWFWIGFGLLGLGGFIAARMLTTAHQAGVAQAKWEAKVKQEDAEIEFEGIVKDNSDLSRDELAARMRPPSSS